MASIGPVVVNVRLFAGLRERAGTDRLEVELPDGSLVKDLLAAMAGTAVGEIKPRECVVAVNREYADADEPVSAGDEVALVPPVSGGESPVRHVRVTAEPLDLAALAATITEGSESATVPVRCSIATAHSPWSSATSAAICSSLACAISAYAS